MAVFFSALFFFIALLYKDPFRFFLYIFHKFRDRVEIVFGKKGLLETELNHLGFFSIGVALQ